ncbi:MAG: NAD(P)/FAD-dependent oxidoreductase, partial [Chloroflexota bacterium]
GAGIAGLSAGCYAQMNGYQTRIYELHTLPGGLCTAWKRKGYTFDGCIHWLVGSKEGSGMNRLWKELGAIDGRKIYDAEVFTRVEDKNGKAFIVYTNIDRLERHILELAPMDKEVIAEFSNAVRRMARMSDVLPAPGVLPNLIDAVKLVLSAPGALGDLRKYGSISIQEYSKKFSDPFLRESFLAFFDMPDFPMAAVMITLAWLHNHDAGYPSGGSLAFAEAIEKRYLNLGGEIHYKRRIEKILVENGRAAGVRLEDGTEECADYVISAADGHATLYDMLEGKFLTDGLRKTYESQPIFDPIVQVSLGIDMDLSEQPEVVNFELDKPVSAGGQTHHRLAIRNFRFDPTMAPPGKSTVLCILPANYEYWKNLADDSERYEAEKKQAAIMVIDELSKRIPALAEHVEVIDVATPLTYERYTANWKGAMEGFMITTQNFAASMSGKAIPKTLPGLQNFYMAGQWTEPGGGLPPAASSARAVVQMICKQDKQAFKTQMVS